MKSNKLNILIETGTDFVLPFTIYDDNDIPVDLTGAKVEAHLREYEASPDYFEFQCVHNNAGGRVTMSLAHETTSQIPYSYGVYDVMITMPDGSITCPLYGDVTVRNGITKASDGSVMVLIGVTSYEDLPEVGNVNRMYYDFTNRVIYRWNGENYVSAFYGGISSVEFIEHVDEYTDKYTMYFDNGSTFDYYITCKGVMSVEKISSEGTIFSGIVDTYRMTFNNGTYVDYQIKNGRMDVEAGIDIEYETPETLVINNTDNTGKYAPKDGNAYVQLNGEWNKINHDISSDSNGVKIKVDWDSDIDNIPQTFPPSAHTHDDRYYTESETDTLLSAKANSADVYSKTETDALLDDKQDVLTFDDVPTDGSDNPVKSNGIYDALATKQDTLTFDNSPTANSNNPVKSGGIKTALDDKSDILIKSASGAIASFDDGIEAPAGNVTVAIEPVQEGEGDPSPSNVRPITGWTGVKVCRTGKNLLMPTQTINPTDTGITWTVQDDGSIIANGTSNKTSQYRFYFNNLYGNFYYTGGFSGQSGCDAYAWDDTAGARLKKWNQTDNCGSDYGNTLQEIFIPKGHNCQILLRINQDITVSNLVFKPMIVKADETDLTYESNQGTTYNVSFGSAGTVYGGSLDASSGKLVVTMGYAEFNGSENWFTALSGTENWYYGYSYVTPFLANDRQIINKYPANNIGNTTTYKGCRIYGGSVRVRWGTQGSVDDFKASLAQEPLQVCAELATPITYQLTPAQVTTLLGQNRIWADTGDVDVSYFTEAGEDVGKAIDNVSKSSKYDDDKTREMITQSSESAMTASKNYTAGNLFIINDKLLRATANIATNGTITIGTNAEEVDLETVIAEKAEKILVAKLPFFSSADLYNNTADFHNAMPRGKDITAYLTDGSLWKRINGTDGYSLFEDLYVGDTITAGGQTYVIVDFDYYIRCGDSLDITQHHLVMMSSGRMSIPAGTVLYNPDTSATPETLTLINTANAGVTVTSQETADVKKWNATMADPNTNSTAGEYKYSRMRQVIMRCADTIVVNAFGASHVKPIQVIYPNPADASASGLASNWAWFKNTDWTAPDRMSICDLPNELQMYGTQAWGRGSAWNNGGYEIGIDKFQFALFKNNRAKVNIRANYWLRGVYSAPDACVVPTIGAATNISSSHAFGVRPRFLLVG